jgi:hypothetical protein
LPKPRRPRFTPEQIQSQSFFLRNQSPYPDNPELLKSLVSHLLKRIETLDKDLGKSIRHLTRWLASLEERVRLFPGLAGDNLKITNAVLLYISAGELSRNSHWYFTLNAQLDWLHDYARKSEFPLRGNNRAVTIQRQEQWIQAHAEPIGRVLIGWPCMCNYTTLEKFEFKSVRVKNETIPTIRVAAMAIVAFVHNTTVENIHKLTKPSNLPQSPSLQPLIDKLKHLLSGQTIPR